MCGRDRGSIVPVCHQTLTNISAILAASHWAAAVCLAYIGDLTASYWCEVRVRVRVEEPVRLERSQLVLCSAFGHFTAGSNV